MNTITLVAGASGNLGQKIVRALRKRNAVVKALVRSGSDKAAISTLEQLGAEIITLEFSDSKQLEAACAGVHCVVSAMAGLHETIVTAQTKLLDAAIAAGVPRFIPSDFSTDFTRLPTGENRNFDLRKEFHEYLDKAAINSTSIYNGAFTDILAYNTPFYNRKNNTVAYWGDDPDWKVDFTTMDNTAEYTAAAALDATTPRMLSIASFQVSANDMVALAQRVNGVTFTLKPMGSLVDFSTYNKKDRAAHPEGEKELYPNWQSSQYLFSMFSVHHEELDNQRYPGIAWTSVDDVLRQIG